MLEREQLFMQQLRLAALALLLAAGAALPGLVMSAALPEPVQGKASGGLVQLATTGNPEGLKAELGGNVLESSVVANTVGQNTLNGLLDINQGEHLAPDALVTPSGDIYAMVAPTITKDNFVLVTGDQVARRMDVGSTEGTGQPFVISEIDPRDLPAAVKGKASAGLVQLATTGNPAGFHQEMRGSSIVDSSAVAKQVGQGALDALLKVDEGEGLAPKALVTREGEIYAMIAPRITKDNFVLVNAGGEIFRMDVGSTEGTGLPYRVTKVVSDGGAPWYVEFWYWLTGA